MSVGQNIKKIREENGMPQQQVAELVSIHRSNKSKTESGKREISIDAIDKIAKYFGLTVDQIVNFDGTTPQEVTTEDKNADGTG